MFSPFSGTPVVSHPLPARASAMVYTPDNEASRRGLAVATETCEMLYLSVSAGAQTDNGEIRQLAGTVGSKSATVRQPSSIYILFLMKFLSSTPKLSLFYTFFIIVVLFVVWSFIYLFLIYFLCLLYFLYFLYF